MNTKEQEPQAALSRLDNVATACEYVTASVHLHGSDKDEHAKDIRLVETAIRELQAERDRLREEQDRNEAVGYWKGQWNAQTAAYDLVTEKLAAAQKRIAELEEHYRCMVSLVQSPSGFTCTEPGAYALNVKVFEDGSGLVKCIEKMRPDQDCYPSLEWQEFHHVVKRLEKAEAENAALRAKAEALANSEVLTRDDVMDDETGAWSFIPKLMEGDVCYIVRALPTPKPDAKEDQP